jgi:sulfate adenylyltransferase subunit 1
MTTTATLPDHGLLRFITCGSVDDGKSTLIGRLLYDTKSILADAYDALAASSRRRGSATVDLSLLTDGLEAEREQGITIDVAYRYFATGTRKYILGDTPGHEQYTRNMVTAASTADLAVILVDARKGVLTQTRRHTAIAHLLGVRHLVVAVNKMDLVGYDETVFLQVQRDYLAFAGDLGVKDLRFIPMSALHGASVVARGDAMPWYEGPTLLEVLETAPLAQEERQLPFRFPVQWVCRPRSEAHRDFRGYAGRVESGSVRPGDEVTVLPSGLRSRVRSILLGDDRLEEACTGQSITLLLEDELDISRGDLFAGPAERPALTRELTATLCWLGTAPAAPGARFLLRSGPRETRAVLQSIHSRLDLATLEACPAERLAMNDLAQVSLRLQGTLALDPYAVNPANGAFILIDETTNATVAAGLVR